MEENQAVCVEQSFGSTLIRGFSPARANDASVLPPASALPAVWSALVSGRYRVARHFVTEHHHWLCLIKSELPRALSARQIRVFQRCLTSPTQNFVGLEEGLAPSTVASLLHCVLDQLGIGGRASRVPFLIAAAACVASDRHVASGCAGNDNSFPEQARHVLTLSAPQTWLSSRLTPTECDVARLRLDGLSLAEMAQRRGRSLRTIANQLSAAYRKLQVSGRAELMVLLAREYLPGTVVAVTE
jgi:DNA-binding CsgD family transcriptional regulator